MNADAATPEPAEALAPPIETPAAPVEDDSLASHEAQFGPNANETNETSLEGEDGHPAPERRKHRAKSQQAGADDVPRIRELTKKLRETEALLEEARRPKPEAAPVARQPQATTATPSPSMPSSSSGFTEKEPTLDDFASEPDPYAAYMRSLARYDRRKEGFEAKQAEAAEAQQREAAAHQADFDRAHVTFRERAQTFAQVHPDYDQLLAEHGSNTNLPPVAYQAVLRADNGPALVYHLLQHPDQLAEMHFLMDGKPVSETSVAFATRWLSSRTQAASTGSAVPTPPVVTAPRPPNPVRTGPMKTGDEVPGDDDSLAAHEKAFWSNRRSR